MEVAIIIGIASIFAIIAQILKQPPFLGFLFAGILVGPLKFVDIANPQLLNFMAQFGVTLLLFIVGLELSFKELKTVGRSAFIIGLGQILLTFTSGFFLAKLLSFNNLQSFYIGLALTFSSTIIVVKLLSDKKDLSSLYGKITIGILLIQDFVVVITLMMLSGLTTPELSLAAFPQLAQVLGKGILLFAVIFILSKSLFPKVVDVVARSQELLFLVSIAWVLILAAIVSSPPLSFSIEIGGLLAGLALANSSEHFLIAARAKPLRDFFITVFFIILGMKLAITNIVGLLPLALAFSILVLVGKPLSALFIMRFLGFKRRTSFFTGLATAQISEFSLVVVALGVSLNHIQTSVASLITLVGIITFTLSTYMILFSEKLFQLLSDWLIVFEKKTPRPEPFNGQNFSNHIILAGVNRMGKKILDTLIKRGDKVVAIDFNPDIINNIASENAYILFGDISDGEVLERANIDKAKLIVSTVPDIEDNLVLINRAKNKNRVKIISIANNEDEAKQLYQAGADLVIIPHLIGGEHIATLLDYGLFAS